MSRLLSLLTLAVTAALLLGGPAAQAKPGKPVAPTGESTTITLRPVVTAALTKAGVTVGVVAPATVNPDGSVTFPVTGGLVRPATLRGVVRHDGGLTLTRRARTITLSDFVIVSRRQAFLTAKVGERRIRLFRLTGAQRTTEDGKAVVTADLRLTEGGARFLSKRFKGRTFRPGLLLGTGKLVATT
jgi:hypothetical protein